jgi:hypothetical protein
MGMQQGKVRCVFLVYVQCVVSVEVCLVCEHVAYYTHGWICIEHAHMLGRGEIGRKGKLLPACA